MEVQTFCIEFSRCALQAPLACKFPYLPCSSFLHWSYAGPSRPRRRTREAAALFRLIKTLEAGGAGGAAGSGAGGP